MKTYSKIIVGVTQVGTRVSEKKFRNEEWIDVGIDTPIKAPDGSERVKRHLVSITAEDALQLKIDLEAQLKLLKYPPDPTQ